MEREKVIELAHQAGFRTLEDGEGATPWHRLARLVEQETLERAARVCESTMLDQYPIGEEVLAVVKDEAIIQCAQAIRNLKDNHDKE